MSKDICEKPFIRPYVINNEGKKLYLRLQRWTPQVERDLKSKGYKYTLIPCGECYYCKKLYRSQWANRLYTESLYYDRTYFITLTYNYNPTFLKRNDLRLFILRLYTHFNRLYGSQIKYFASGEYGSLNGRPHYHLIVYGLPELQIDDLKNCDEIRSLWNKGIVQVVPAEYGSFNYVAGYTAKKLDNLICDKKIKPFCVMSKGLGKRYFDEHKDKLYHQDSLCISNRNSTYMTSLPRYFDKLMNKINPNKLKEVKDNRELSIIKDTQEKLKCSNKAISDTYFAKAKFHKDIINSKRYKI